MPIGLCVQFHTHQSWMSTHTLFWFGVLSHNGIMGAQLYHVAIP